MNKLIKLLSLALACMLLFASLAACGDELPDTTEPEVTKPDTTAAPVSTAPPVTTELESVTTQPVETDPEAVRYYSPGTTTVYLTELERAADGTMIPTGNRNLVGIFDGLGAMYDEKTFTDLVMDTSVIKFDSNRMLGAFDNVIVAIAPVDKP